MQKAKKTKEIDHSRFDARLFDIKVAEALKAKKIFRGQCGALLDALIALKKKVGKPHVSGEQVRTFLENNKEKYFKGSIQADPLRIFQDNRNILSTDALPVVTLIKQKAA